MKAEEIKENPLSDLPPCYSLDYYQIVIDTLQTIEFQVGSEIFSEKELLKTITERGTKNPFLASPSERAVQVYPEIEADLVNSGLLDKVDSELAKGLNFESARAMVRKLSGKGRLLLGWSAYWLTKARTSTFEAGEIQEAIRYPEWMVTKEIRANSKNGGSHLNLRASGDKLIIGVDLDSHKSDYFTLGCLGRIRFILALMARTSSETTEDEILARMSEFEVNLIESFLEELGLHKTDGKWRIESDSSSRLLAELSIPLWPSYGISVLREPAIKVGSNDIYVDVPNSLTQSFLAEASQIPRANLVKLQSEFQMMLGVSKEVGLERARSLHAILRGSDYFKLLTKNAKEHNDLFQERMRQLRIKDKDSGWFTLWVAEQIEGQKWFSIRCRLDWKKFLNFQDSLARNEEVTLADKYGYLASCRYGIASHFAETPEMPKIQGEVRTLVSNYLEATESSIGVLLDSLSSVKLRLTRRSRQLRSHHPMGFATLAYLPEMMNTIRALSSLSAGGALPSCYREMRKILENLSWVVLDDLLYLRMSSGSEDVLLFEPPYRNANTTWFDWCRKGGHNLPYLDKLTDRLDDLLVRAQLSAPERRASRKAILDNLTYPLLLTLTYEPTQKEPASNHVPTFSSKDLDRFAKVDIARILEGQLGEDSITNIGLGIATQGQTVVPRYPSNEFVRHLLDETSGNAKSSLYDQYSFFVHSNFEAWGIFPFSSILEFKIFHQEFLKFKIVVEQTLELLDKTKKK